MTLLGLHVLRFPLSCRNVENFGEGYEIRLGVRQELPVAARELCEGGGNEVRTSTRPATLRASLNSRLYSAEQRGARRVTKLCYKRRWRL
jgi:hypothetical protein